MTIYRINLPDVTRIKNHRIFILSTPATTVNGSPITGTQARNRENTPYFLNLSSAFINSSSEIFNIFCATTLLPKNPIAYFYLALVYVAIDKFDDAETSISEAMMSLDTLTVEDRAFILSRITNELKLLAQTQPDKTDEIERIQKLIPQP